MDLIFRTGYDFSFGERGDVVFPKDEPSLTVQDARDECDINLIVQRADFGMRMAQGAITPKEFFDASEVPDYQTALNIVNSANSQFEALPAAVRDRFANSPALLLAFLADENNRDEATRLGLVPKKEAATPVAVPSGSAASGGDPAKPAAAASGEAKAS